MDKEIFNKAQKISNNISKMEELLFALPNTTLMEIRLAQRNGRTYCTNLSPEATELFIGILLATAKSFQEQLQNEFNSL